MKVVNAVFFALISIAISSLVGCAYGSAVSVGNNEVVILRNDAFLAGLLRKAYVCKAGPSGLTNCRDSESP